MRYLWTWLSVFCFLGGFPAGAETLSGGDIRLRGGLVSPAASGPLTNESETLHLEGSTLSLLGAGQSSSSSGIQLHVGTAPVPEPTALWQLGAGVLGLGLLSRRSGRRK